MGKTNQPRYFRSRLTLYSPKNVEQTAPHLEPYDVGTLPKKYWLRPFLTGFTGCSGQPVNNEAGAQHEFNSLEFEGIKPETNPNFNVVEFNHFKSVESAKLDEVIRKNLEGLGYGE